MSRTREDDGSGSIFNKVARSSGKPLLTRRDLIKELGD